jgi:hypothetical protein
MYGKRGNTRKRKGNEGSNLEKKIGPYLSSILPEHLLGLRLLLFSLLKQRNPHLNLLLFNLPKQRDPRLSLVLLRKPFPELNLYLLGLGHLTSLLKLSTTATKRWPTNLSDRLHEPRRGNIDWLLKSTKL